MEYYDEIFEERKERIKAKQIQELLEEKQNPVYLQLAKVSYQLMTKAPPNVMKESV
jgi:hypothetical protein